MTLQQIKDYFGYDDFIEGNLAAGVSEEDRKLIRGLGYAALVVGTIEVFGVALLIGVAI